MNNKNRERIMNLSMKYCTAFLGGMAVNPSVLNKVFDMIIKSQDKGMINYAKNV